MKEWIVEIRRKNIRCLYRKTLWNEDNKFYDNHPCTMHLNESGKCTFEDCPIKITPENI